MSYPHREKNVQTSTTEQTPKPAASGASAVANANTADLKLLMNEFKTLLQENRNADEILVANLEEWTDLVGEHLTESFVKAVQPALIEQKGQLDKMQVAINNLKDEVSKLKRIRGFKNFLIWLSIVCNIGIAGYLIYLLVKGVMI